MKACIYNYIGVCRACWGRASKSCIDLLLQWEATSCLRCACLASGVSVLLLSCWAALAVGIQWCLPSCPAFCMKGKNLAKLCASIVSGPLPSLLHSLYLSLRQANRTSLSSAVSVALALRSHSFLLQSLSHLRWLSSVFILKHSFKLVFSQTHAVSAYACSNFAVT